MGFSIVTREQTLSLPGTAQTISVGTSWTLVPTTATVGRLGIFVTVDDAAGGNCYGLLTTTSDAPATATTVRAITFLPGVTQKIPIGTNVYLWLVSGTGSKSVHMQEYSQ
jgi:hypothetical protein